MLFLFDSLSYQNTKLWSACFISAFNSLRFVESHLAHPFLWLCSLRHPHLFPHKKQAFPVAASWLWNNVLQNVTLSASLTVFNKCLKTYLFHLVRLWASRSHTFTFVTMQYNGTCMSWGVNRHTAQHTGPVSMVLQLLMVPCWGPQIRDYCRPVAEVAREELHLGALKMQDWKKQDWN